MIVLMTHDEFDYVIDDIIIDMLLLIKNKVKGLKFLTHWFTPHLSVAIVSNSSFFHHEQIFYHISMSFLRVYGIHT